MPVTMRLVFRAMTEQRHGLIFGQVLQEPQREFLPVILDSLVAAINRPVFPQFAAITAAEFRPGDFAGLKFLSQSLARSQVGHPNVKPVRRQTPPAEVDLDLQRAHVVQRPHRFFMAQEDVVPPLHRLDERVRVQPSRQHPPPHKVRPRLAEVLHLERRPCATARLAAHLPSKLIACSLPRD